MAETEQHLRHQGAPAHHDGASADPESEGSKAERYDDDDDLFDLYPTPPPALRGESLRPSNLGAAQAAATPTPRNVAPPQHSERPPAQRSERPSAQRSERPPPPRPSRPTASKPPDRWAGGAIRAALRPPSEARADAPPLAPDLPIPPSPSPVITPREEKAPDTLRSSERNPALDRAPEPPPPASLAPAQPPAAAYHAPDRPLPKPPSPAEDTTSGSFTAREIFSTDYYVQQWGRAGLRGRSEEVDELGLDPQFEARYRPFFDFLYKHYFRIETQGVANIPAEGRCVIVSNHSGGALPFDGIMLRTAMRHEPPSARDLRWLTEDFLYHLPFVGVAMNRLGAVRACQENAERLLSQGRLVAVFPEGEKGIGKLFKDRYRLQRFGRGGFIRLCLRTRTPLVPCAVIGAEEANPMLYKIERMTKALGVPYLPVTPTFPALGPLGLLPAPTKWKIRFGEAITFEEHGPEAAEDDILVNQLAERVRGAIQGLLHEGLSARRSIWFG